MDEAIKDSIQGSVRGTTPGETDTVLVAVAESSGAKGVKDILKACGWLSDTHKPRTCAATGCIAFPVIKGSANDLRNALTDCGPDGALASVLRLELIPFSEMTRKKKPPRQKGKNALHNLRYHYHYHLLILFLHLQLCRLLLIFGIISVGMVTSIVINNGITTEATL